MVVGEGCIGVKCGYFKQCYDVQAYQGGFTPDFHAANEYCLHPSIYKPSDDVRPIDRNGVRLQVVKHCPIGS